MIDTSAEPMVNRLSAVRCGQCSRPVTHLNRSVPGSEAGGLCTNCKQDERGRVKVYTYIGIAPCECGCHLRSGLIDRP